jgi:hypothetical protein
VLVLLVLLVIIIITRQSKCNIDSVIINQNHVAIFANWIHEKGKTP